MRRAHRICVLIAGTVVMVLAADLSAVAQPQPSLAEIARREIERRKALASPARVYTNDDLKNVRPLTTAAAQPTSAAPGTAASTAAGPSGPAAGDPLADRLVAAREAVASARAAFDEAQARVNALTADWVGAPDEATRTSIAAARDVAATEADRIRADIDARVKAIAQLELEVLRQARPVPPPK